MNIFDGDFPGAVEFPKGATFDEVSWIVGLSRINGEDFIVVDIHVLFLGGNVA
jgi:hypothetical protein